MRYAMELAYLFLAGVLLGAADIMRVRLLKLQRQVQELAVTTEAGEVATTQRLQELVRLELVPLQLELRHLDLFLRQLQELHPDRSHPNRTSHPRRSMYRLRCLWAVMKNPDAVAVSRRPRPR